MVGAQRELRLGWIGFGKLARDYYTPVLRSHPFARVVAVADPLEASRGEARRAFPDAQVHGAADAVFEATLDGLLVASPPSTHLGFWNRAVAGNLPVFLEKPFVLPGELPRALPDPGALLTVNLNRRFWPPYRALRAQLANAAIGEVESAAFRLHVPVLRWCTVTHHRLEPGEGGALADLGSQLFDLAGYLLGELPECISAKAQSHRWPDDHLQVRMAGAGQPDVSFDLAYSDRGSESVEVRGSRGTLVLRDPNMALHRFAAGSTRALRSRALDLFTLGGHVLRRSQSMMRFTIRAALESFLERVTSSEVVGFRDAARHVRLLEATQLALRDPEISR